MVHRTGDAQSAGKGPFHPSHEGKAQAVSDQRNGFGWLWFLYENGFSGFCCDDMGLGKTHQIMALMTGILYRKAKKRANSVFGRVPHGLEPLER